MKIGLYLAAVLAASCAQGALAQTAAPPAAPAAGPETRFTARDLFDLSMASDPQISPDGTRIAYVRVSNDIMTDRARSAIWLVDTKTGEQVPLAGGADAGAFSPVWSPDGTADNPAFFGRYWLGPQPWENQELYWKLSPLSLVGNVKTPTMVVVGAEDYRTPVSESEQFYSALRLRGVPTALVKIPGASHGGIAARPSQSAAKASAILAWFEKYKAGAPTKTQP